MISASLSLSSRHTSTTRQSMKSTQLVRFASSASAASKAAPANKQSSKSTATKTATSKKSSSSKPSKNASGSGSKKKKRGGGVVVSGAGRSKKSRAFDGPYASNRKVSHLNGPRAELVKQYWSAAAAVVSRRERSIQELNELNFAPIGVGHAASNLTRYYKSQLAPQSGIHLSNWVEHQYTRRERAVQRATDDQAATHARWIERQRAQAEMDAIQSTEKGALDTEIQRLNSGREFVDAKSTSVTQSTAGGDSPAAPASESDDKSTDSSSSTSSSASSSVDNVDADLSKIISPLAGLEFAPIDVEYRSELVAASARGGAKAVAQLLERIKRDRQRAIERELAYEPGWVTEGARAEATARATVLYKRRARGRKELDQLDAEVDRLRAEFNATPAGRRASKLVESMTGLVRAEVARVREMRVSSGAGVDSPTLRSIIDAIPSSAGLIKPSDDTQSDDSSPSLVRKRVNDFRSEYESELRALEGVTHVDAIEFDANAYRGDALFDRQLNRRQSVSDVVNAAKSQVERELHAEYAKAVELTIPESRRHSIRHDSSASIPQALTRESAMQAVQSHQQSKTDTEQRPEVKSDDASSDSTSDQVQQTEVKIDDSQNVKQDQANEQIVETKAAIENDAQSSDTNKAT